MADVVLSEVSKSYGSLEVIEGLNLKIEDGSFTVFVGPSGCGKSTLLRMIAGLEPITKGTLEIDGKTMNQADPIERGVAMVFQNYALYPHMTVEQNIGFSLRMAGLTKDEIAARVAVAAKTLQIEPLLKRKPGQLSGGQRQRVAIGRAIVRDPEVFLFDEPLSNLDAELRVSMRVEIAKLHNQLGSTMIYVTHDQTEAMTLADKIVVMRAGKIEQAGTPEELYDNPDNLFVAGFIGSPRMNFLRGTLGGGQVKLETGGALPATGAEEKVLVGVRPEHFVEAGQGAVDVAVTVDVVENLGGTRFVYGTLSTGESVVIEARERLGLKAGDTISFGIRPERAMLFSTSGTRLREHLMTNILWYRQPATEWTDALPLGNGRLGAMVHGGVGREELQLNESTLWSGGPYQPTNPEALPNLAKVRELIFAERYREAHDIAQAHLLAKPYLQMSYQPAGNLFVDFRHEAVPGSYERRLDLTTAVTTTQYTLLGSGLDPDAPVFTRTAFSSAADDVLVLQLECSLPGKLDFELWLDSPQPGDLVGDEAERLSYRGRNFGKHGIEGQLTFGIDTHLRVEGGSVERRGRRLIVRDADKALILVDIATSFVRFDDVSGDPDARLVNGRQRYETLDFDTLLSRHVAAHREQFERLDIDLGEGRSDLPTDERIANFAGGDDPGLAALYVQYARYLMISSSRPGTQPSTLQGIWNKDTRPPWGSKYTANINLQMNYWLPDPANLPDMVEPVLQMAEELAVTGAEMARAHYGARGWVMHHNTDIWRATGPVDGAYWGVWPTGGAWLMAQLWDHVRFAGRPTDLVRRLYGPLKGATLFALDTLVPMPGSNYLVTNPSISPENRHPHGASLCAGPTMDNQILRDLLGAFAQAAEQLGEDADIAAEALEARARLPEHRIGKAGQLQEWMEDWDMEVPEIHHRHVSHLYGLYPSDQIGVETTPDLAHAVRRSLEIRGDEATGWGIGWRINLWARLREGEHAKTVLNLLLSPARSYNNLFDAHPPFQIDGNFGGAAGILEMLVQSSESEIWLLPALPQGWRQGEVRGVRARGGIELDFAWADRRVTSLRVRSNNDRSVRVSADGQAVVLELRAGVDSTHEFEG